MEKVLHFFNTLIACDKLMHSFYLTITYMLLVFISFFITDNIILSIILITTFITVLAIAKEVYDKTKIYHTSDIYDILYGIAIPILFSLIILYIHNKGL